MSMRRIIQTSVLFACFLHTTSVAAEDIGPPLAYVDESARVEGISAPIRITRDKHGVPTIEAETSADAAFALGFVHAEDRLWQMEYQRRKASGMLAELAGISLLDSDRYYRTLGLRVVAERNLDRLDRGARALLDAYAKGVNAWIATAGDALPPEYRIYDFEPQPWTPTDSLVVQKWFGFDLGKNWPTEMERLLVTARLGSPKAFDLNPVNPDETGIEAPDLDALYAGVLRPPATGELPAVDEVEKGSNNWGVNGDRSGTGFPIIANDPHLPISNTSPYYLVRQEVTAGSEDQVRWIAGASMSGMPVVRFGQTADIAWSFTSMAPDSQDLFIERDTADRPGFHDTAVGPRPYEVRREVIRVKGADDHILNVRRTDRGPVLSDVLPKMQAALQPGYSMSVAWPGFADVDRTLETAIGMAHAERWEDFREALEGHVGPHLNIIYGDSTGTIAYRAAGPIPVRRDDHPTHGLAPAPAWLASSQWKGMIPFEDMHEEVNPGRGWLATANHKTTPPGYPYTAFPDKLPDWRYDRLEELFSAEETFSMMRHLEMQNELYSNLDVEMRNLLLPMLGAEHAEVAAMLRAWGGSMDGARPEPLIMSNWLRHVTRSLYADELGPLFPSMWRLRSAFLKKALTGKTSGDWCADATRSSTMDCETLVREALSSALEELSEKHGGAMETWRWDEAFRFDFNHPLLGGDAAWGKTFNRSIPGKGGMVTLNVAYFPYRPEPEFIAIVAASYRAIYDLGDPARSRFMITNGQSADPRSRHYDDLTTSWSAGGYMPLLGDGSVVRTTQLRPR